MKKLFLVFCVLIFGSNLAFAQYKLINNRDFDNYEPVPKNLQAEYIKQIPENVINSYRIDMSNSIKHILFDKITYEHTTLKQMLTNFEKRADTIFKTYSKDTANKKQNQILIKQLNDMRGTISLYPNAIIEEMQSVIQKYELDVSPGTESDTFLYKYYVERYHIKYSANFKELLKYKEYVYAKIDYYISNISEKT